MAHYKWFAISIVHYRHYIIPHKQRLNQKARLINAARAMVMVGKAHERKRKENATRGR